MNTKVNNLLERYKGIVFFFDSGKYPNIASSYVRAFSLSLVLFAFELFYPFVCFYER